MPDQSGTTTGSLGSDGGEAIKKKKKENKRNEARMQFDALQLKEFVLGLA